MTQKLTIKEVPCNGCTLCCQGDAVKLDDEDLAMNYQTEPHPYIPGALMIAHKENGDCVYLEKDGCSIHDHAPSLCRAADCRSIAFRLSFERAMELHRIGRLDMRVWDQGYKLVENMKSDKNKEQG